MLLDSVLLLIDQAGCRQVIRASLPHDALQLPGKAALTVRTPRGTDAGVTAGQELAASDMGTSGLDAADWSWLAAFNAGSESPAHSNANSTDPSTASTSSVAMFVTPGSPVVAAQPAAAVAAEPLQPLAASTLAAALACLDARAAPAGQLHHASFAAQAEQCLHSTRLPVVISASTAKAIVQHWQSKRTAISTCSGQVAGAAAMLRHSSSSSALRNGERSDCTQPYAHMVSCAV